MSQKKLSSFLESMGISTEDVWTLFMIMDNDQTGLVNLEEFVSGGMQGDRGMGCAIGWVVVWKSLQIINYVSLALFLKNNLAARAWSLGRHLENTSATGTWSMEQDDVATPSLHRVTMPFARQVACRDKAQPRASNWSKWVTRTRSRDKRSRRSGAEHCSSHCLLVDDVWANCWACLQLNCAYRDYSICMYMYYILYTVTHDGNPINQPLAGCLWGSILFLSSAGGHRDPWGDDRPLWSSLADGIASLHPATDWQG